MTHFWYIFAGFNVLLFTAVIAVSAILSRRRRSNKTGTLTPEEQRQRWEARAPGWQIRCLKCDFTEPFGKYGIRMRAAGKKYTWGYCSHCRGLRFYIIEHERTA
jgi:hypothetical protein